MIIFDLDGTLLDVWERYYLVFNKWWKFNNLEIKTFIKLKRELEGDYDIVRYLNGYVSSDEYRKYVEFKRNNIENPSFLTFDKELMNLNKLKNLPDRYFILTIRYNKEILHEEFKRRHLDGILSNLVILNPSDKLAKYRWVSENVGNEQEIIVVGDSETDLLIGMLDNVKVNLVRTGLRDPDKLIKKYKTQIKNNVCVFDNIEDFIKSYDHVRFEKMKGVNATILPGKTIHEDGFVRAGVVVTKDVEGGKVVVGNPAREK